MPTSSKEVKFKKTLYIEYVKDHNVLLDHAFGYLQLYLLREGIPLTLRVYLTDCTAVEGLNPQAFKPQPGEAEIKNSSQYFHTRIIEYFLLYHNNLPLCHNIFGINHSLDLCINPLTLFHRSTHLLHVQNKADFDLFSLCFVSVHVT